jgi:glyoxylase-like metal-dependent hydrolase (beta-lactamase superfamily II)
MSQAAEETRIGGLVFLPGPNKGKYPHCHSLYVEGDRILIDPASDRERLARLKDEEGVDEVWLTHWHEDHFAHLDLFEDARLSIHALDEPPLGNIETFMDWYGMDRQADENLRNTWKPLILEQFHFTPRKPHRLFSGNEEITLPSCGKVKVIHAPGHTPGHCAFYFEDFSLLCTADYDLTPFGPWYGDPGSSMKDTAASVRALSQLNAKWVMTCHETGLFENPPESLWTDYTLVIQRREEALVTFLATGPKTMQQIVEQWIVYKKRREPIEFYSWGEKATMTKHLEALMKAGRVQQTDNRYSLKE